MGQGVPAAEKPLLLVVGASQATRFASCQTLEAAGFACVAAATGTEALALVCARRPALAVVDTQLPGGEGLALCRELVGGAGASRLWVVLASRAPAPGERVAALEGGADGYAALDEGPAELVATVRALLRRGRAGMAPQAGASDSAEGGRGSFGALDRQGAWARRLAGSGLFGAFEWSLAGPITEANDAFLALLGYTREDLEAGRLSWEALTPPEWRELDARAVRELRERGMCQPLEMQYIRQDGSRVDVLLGGVCFEGDRERGITFVVDITARKHAERELRRREHELRMLADNTPDVIARFDRAGRHLFISRSVERFTGLRPEAFLGRTNAEVGLPPALARQWDEALGQALQGRDLSVELELQTPGGPRCLLTRLVPERDEAGHVVTVLSIARDITERKQAEAAIRESEDRLRMALESTGLGTWDRNPLTGVTRWDARCKALFGLEPDAYVDRELLLSAVHPEDRERVARALDRALDPTSGRELHIEFRAIGVRDGVERWLASRGRAHLDAEGRPHRLTGIMQDITESKVAEEAQRKLAALVENSTDFIAMMALEGELSFLNEAGRRLVGLDGLDDGAERLHLTELFSAEDASAWTRDVLPTALHTGRWRGEFRLRHLQTGALVPVDHSLFLIREPGTGDPIALATVSRDITRQKADAERLRRQADFEQRLIGIVSHDLRSPLQAISASAFLLQRLAAHLPERASVAARRISNATEKMQRMVEDLLDFTRAHLGTGIPVYPRACNLHTLIQQAVDEVEAGRPGRRFSLRLQGDGAGHWDSGRLLQVLSNLLANAINYSPEESVVELECRGDAESVELAVRNRNKSGPIPPHQLASIFEPFKRLEPSAGGARGLGLGLYIVERIVLGHGGKVSVESTAEHGTTFRVRLPRGSDAPALANAS